MTSPTLSPHASRVKRDIRSYHCHVGSPKIETNGRALECYSSGEENCSGVHSLTDILDDHDDNEEEEATVRKDVVRVCVLSLFPQLLFPPHFFCGGDTN